MPTAKAGYFLKNGTKVPSVTTVLSRFKESGGLIHWAWKLGIEGKDYRAVRDEAGAAGTLAHDWIEQAAGGATALPPAHDPSIAEEIWLQAETALASFRKWKAAHPSTELLVLEQSLVSEDYEFGGTLDAMGRVDGELCILDWKTSKSLHADAVAQMAAYRQLWNENHPDQQVGATGHVVRFMKDAVGYEHKVVNLATGWRYFEAVLAAYAADKDLQREFKR